MGLLPKKKKEEVKPKQEKQNINFSLHNATVPATSESEGFTAEDIRLIIAEWLKPDHVDFKTRYTKRQVRAMTKLQPVADRYNIKCLKEVLKAFRIAFEDYFTFVKDQAKAKEKKEGGGILKTLHEFAPNFFDFKIWKKLTGQARNPELAALHQIRDLLIQVNDPKGKKGFKQKFGKDPMDLFEVIFKAFNPIKNMYRKENENGFAAIIKTPFRFLKDAWEEQRNEYRKQGIELIS